MDFTTIKRINTRSRFLSQKQKRQYKKTIILGAGGEGQVYEYCSNGSKSCVAVKHLYIGNTEAKYFNDPFNTKALKYNSFIELTASRLVSILIEQNICPNFVMHYTWDTKSRVGVCDDLYPYKVYHYNEYIEKAQTYTDWVKENHTTEEFFNCYFQIITAVYCIQKHFNMKHLDLHSDNILVRKVKPDGIWEYKLEDETYYVPNLGYIFYLNDFGQAWIPKKFRSIFIKERLRPKHIHKGYDIMKLFRSTLSISSSNKKFKSTIRKIINKLRENESFENIIHEFWAERYSKKGRSNVIESYQLDKKIKRGSVIKPLREFIVHK